MDYFQGNTWFAGVVYSQKNGEDKGVLLKNITISEMIIVDYPINHLRHTEEVVIAAADSGKLYILGNTVSNREVKANAKYKMYPNPTNSNIKIKSLVIGNTYNLYGIDGRLIMSFTATNDQEILNLSSLENGIYIFEGQKIIKM